MRMLFATLTWRLVSAGAVMTPQTPEDGEPDAVPVQDGEGRFVIPGTSLAGSLRAHAAGIGWSESEADDLFGSIRGDRPRAGRIWVYSAGVDLPPATEGAVVGATVSERRTAIDRQRQAARNRSLRHQEFLPAGSIVTVFLKVEGADAALVARVESLVTGWEPRLGAGVSTGHGETELQTVRLGELDLSLPDQLSTYLSRGGTSLWDAVAIREVTPAPNRSVGRLELRFRSTGSLAVGSGDAPGKKDGHDVTPILRRQGEAVIPGSTWKGVIRSRIEYALRTLLDEGDSRRPCLDQQCLHCATCELFGSGGGTDTIGHEGRRSGGRRSLVAFSDSVIDGGRSMDRQHVAIDRFTGGSADGLLWTNETVEGGAVTMTLTRLPHGTKVGEDGFRSIDPHTSWSLVSSLVRLAAMDIDDGFVGVGSNTTRGYGTLEWLDRDEAQLRADRQAVRAFVEGGAA